MGLFDFLKKKTPSPAAETPAITPIKASNLQGFYELSIANVVHETADAISIYLDIPAHLQAQFQYQPGQYVTLRVDIDNTPYLRCYSISSCPYSDNYFRIAIKTKIGGKVSGYLVKNCQKGMLLDVFTPLGNFTPVLNNNTNNYILYGGGSGITPLLSIAKTLLHEKNASFITLLYANRNEASIIYDKELQVLHNQYPNRFAIHHVLDETTSTPNTQQLKGTFTAQDYANWVRNINNFAQAEHFICGPEGMMQAVKQGLSEIARINMAQIHLESFDFSQQSQERGSQHTTAILANDITTNGDGLGTNATITINRKQHYIHIEPNNTILTACLDNGIDAPFMCEAGVCSSCRAKLVQGKATMQVCYALSDKEVAEGYILTCQAIPQSNDIEVNYDA